MKRFVHTELKRNLRQKIFSGVPGDKPPPFRLFYGLKFLPLDQLQNAFAQLFLDNGYVF